MSQPKSQATAKKGGQKAISTPNLTALVELWKEHGLPTLGLGVAPSVRSLKIHPNQRPGFIKHQEVLDAAKQAGLPEEYVPKLRSDSDAFRRACFVKSRDSSLRQQGYLMERKNKDLWIVLKREEHSKLRDKADTVQAIWYDHEEADPNLRMKVNGKDVVTVELDELWELHKTCLTTDEVSTVVTKALTDFAYAVSLRKGGGVYYVPKTQEQWPLNPNLEKIRAFCATLQGKGEVWVGWSMWPYPDAPEIRNQLDINSQITLQKQGRNLTREVDELREKLQGTFKKVRERDARRTKMQELIELEQQARLLSTVLGSNYELLERDISHLQDVLRALMSGLPAPPEPVDFSLRGADGDADGEEVEDSLFTRLVAAMNMPDEEEHGELVATN